MEYKEVLAARHSVRRFKEEAVDRSLIDEMIDEALLAPSSKHSASSGFMVIEDPSVLEAISEMRSAARFVKGAAAAIVVLGDSSKSDLWVENSSISATYLMLSAVDKGLGSCWVQVAGRLRDSSDPLKGDAEGYLRELLGVKDNMRILCVIALGYKDEA